MSNPPVPKLKFVTNSTTAIFNCLFRQFPRMKALYEPYIEGAFLQYDHKDSNTLGRVGIKITLKQPPYKDLLIYDGTMVIFENTIEVVKGFGILPNKFHLNQMDEFKASEFSHFWNISGNNGRNYANIFFNAKNGIQRFGAWTYRRDGFVGLGQLLRVNSSYICPLRYD